MELLLCAARPCGPLLMMSTAGVTCYRQEPCQQSAVNHERGERTPLSTRAPSVTIAQTGSPLNRWKEHLDTELDHEIHDSNAVFEE